MAVIADKKCVLWLSRSTDGEVVTNGEHWTFHDVGPADELSRKRGTSGLGRWNGDTQQPVLQTDATEPDVVMDSPATHNLAWTQQREESQSEDGPKCRALQRRERYRV